MIIFNGQRLNRGLVANVPPGALFVTSKTENFLSTGLNTTLWKIVLYIDLLIMDEGSSNIILVVLQLTKENEIEILCIQPHTTSELQTLNKCVLKPLKTYNKACMQFLKETPGRIITRYEFCELFTAAYHKISKMLYAASAFCATIILSFKPSIIHLEVCGPSVVSHSPSQKATVDLMKLGNLIKNALTLILNLNQIWSLLLLIAQFHAHQAMFFLVFYRSPHLKGEKVTCLHKISRNHISTLSYSRWSIGSIVDCLLRRNSKTKKAKKSKNELRNETEGKSENLAKKKGRKKQKQRRKRKQIFCNYCHGYYYDDESDDEY